MEEERRANDIAILRELSEINTRLTSFMEHTGGMVAAHQKTLHGEYGNNGLSTVVSKHKDYFTVIFWLLALLIAAFVTIASSRYTTAEVKEDGNSRPVSQAQADRQSHDIQ